MSKDWIQQVKFALEQRERLKIYMDSCPQDVKVKISRLWVALKDQLRADAATYTTEFPTAPRMDVTESASPIIEISRSGPPRFLLKIQLHDRMVSITRSSREEHLEIRFEPQGESFDPVFYRNGEPMHDLSDVTELLLRPHVEELAR